MAESAVSSANIQNGLMEVEILHRQEELEQLQLEQAIAMSLALEEEKIRKTKKEEKENGIAVENESKSVVKTDIINKSEEKEVAGNSSDFKGSNEVKGIESKMSSISLQPTKGIQ